MATPVERPLFLRPQVQPEGPLPRHPETATNVNATIALEASAARIADAPLLLKVRRGGRRALAEHRCGILFPEEYCLLLTVAGNPDPDVSIRRIAPDLLDFFSDKGGDYRKPRRQVNVNTRVRSSNGLPASTVVASVGVQPLGC